MANQSKKKFEHPITSGLIVAAIGGASSLLWPPAFARAKAAWKALEAVGSGLGRWLGETTGVWNWVLLVAAALTCFFLTHLVRAMVSARTPSQRPPKPTDYRTDMIDGARWFWNVGSGGEAWGLHACCPQCLMQLVERGTYEYPPRTRLFCESCNVERVMALGDRSELEGRVVRVIHQKWRNGSWVQAVEQFGAS